MKLTRVHLADPSSDLSGAVCGFLAVRTTEDRGAVTCRSCLRRMHVERESIPDYVDDRWFIEQTRKPLPMVNLSRRDALVWKYALEGCARVITETDADPRRDPRNGPRAPFASVSDALARHVVVKVDGYQQTSVGDPERFKRLTGQLGGFSAPSGSPTSRAQGQAELSAEVHRALVAAFPRAWDSPPVSAEHCREIVILRFAGGRSNEEVAGDMLAARDVAVTAGQVRRISRWGFAQVWEWLTVRGLIPTPTGRVVRDEISSGEIVEKKLCTDADLRGWIEIAEFLDVTPSTAQAWEREAGLPVRRFMGRVEARSDELRAWREKRTERPNAA